MTQVSHHNAMPQMEAVPFSNEEYGTCNPSFSFQEKAGVYTHQDRPPCPEPVPPNVAPDNSFILADIVYSPVIFNNNCSTPRKSFSTFLPITVEVNQTQGAPPPTENLRSPTPPPDTTPDPTEVLPDSPSPDAHDAHDAPPTPPLTGLDSQTNTTDDPVDPADPADSPSPQSSPSSVHCSDSRISAAEIDKPFSKPSATTPPNKPYSPLLSSPLPRQTRTPPPTPENAPLRAKLVHIDTSPHETPPVTPEPRVTTEEDQPCTSLDQPDQSEPPGGAADAGSPSQDRRPSTVSKGGRGLGGEDDDSEGELEEDEEELLRVMARCNPVFITFSK